jgi:hypothetical protein
LASEPGCVGTAAPRLSKPDNSAVPLRQDLANTGLATGTPEAPAESKYLGGKVRQAVVSAKVKIPATGARVTL